MPDLDVRFHALGPEPPAGWDSYRRSNGLTCAWDWSLMRARAADRKILHLALTVVDGDVLVGVGSARLPGVHLRAGPTTALGPGVLDVECLVSSALGGVEVDGDREGYENALTGLRHATRRRFGRRVAGILLRQVPERLLPVATRFPSIVLEAPPIGRHRLAYESFDAYLRGLAQSRRNEYRQLERDARVIVTYTGRGDRRPELDVDAALVLANDPVHRHHRHWWRPKRLMGRMLLTAAARHPEVEVITYERESGGLLGFGLVLTGGPWPVDWVAGAVRPGAGVPRGLWFHRELTYAKHGIEHGVEGYVSGAGADASKVRLGHQMTPVWSVFHPLVGGESPRFLPTGST